MYGYFHAVHGLGKTPRNEIARLCSNSNRADATNIPYQLRNSLHNITLINKTKFLNDTDFIIRMLYK